MSRATLIGLAVLALAGAGWRITVGQGADRPKTAASSADERQKEILRDNLNRPGDPALVRRFGEINARHFSNTLQPMPVLWEERLSEVSALSGRTFTLLGVFGQSGDKTIILLHPSLKGDAAGLDRALSHEMVHAYLFALGDTSTNHGEQFQAVLRRLANEGAFVGLPASAAERAELRAWLDAESKRLEDERKAMDLLAADLERERPEVERTFDASRRTAYNERAGDLNRRSVEFGVAQEAYNREVARYNLMVSYPDGMDEK